MLFRQSVISSLVLRHRHSYKTLCINTPRFSKLRQPYGAIRSYSQEVHDHFQKPRNVGSFNAKDENIGTAIVGKASCGDVIKLQVKIENDIIQDVRFKAFGCGSAIASSSLASELIKGKTCNEALQVKNVDIANHLSLPPVKIHCSLLAEDAVKHAILDYKKKHPVVVNEIIFE